MNLLLLITKNVELNLMTKIGAAAPLPNLYIIIQLGFKNAKGEVAPAKSPFGWPLDFGISERRSK